MKRITVALLLIFAASLPAQAAVDMFLEIPGIEGESVVEDFEKQIDVLSWSQSVANVNDMPVVLPFVFTHFVDKATPKLIEAALMGTDLDRATLRVVRIAGEKPLVFLTIMLRNPRVVAVQNGGSGSEDRLTESVTLTCASFTYTYVRQDAMGQAPPVEVTGSCGK